VRTSPINEKKVHAFLDGLFGDELHAKRVLSLSLATLGVVHAASLSVYAIGQALALARAAQAAASQAARLNAQKTAFRNTRARVRSALAAEDIEFSRELEALPVALVRTNNRGALVKLLNHPSVVGIAENFQMKHQMTESLAGIHQPAAIPGSYTGAGTTVVVIDNGTDYTNAAFGGCTAPGTPPRAGSSWRIASSRIPRTPIKPPLTAPTSRQSWRR
jgi:hypothetical protein